MTRIEELIAEVALRIVHGEELSGVPPVEREGWLHYASTRLELIPYIEAAVREAAHVVTKTVRSPIDCIIGNEILAHFQLKPEEPRCYVAGCDWGVTGRMPDGRAHCGRHAEVMD